MPDAIFVVMPSPEVCQDVLDTWEKRGVTGITILESMGLQTNRRAPTERDDLPLLPSLRNLLEGEEYHHRTIFAVVDDGFDLDGLILATEHAAGGDFNAPNSGMLFVVPVSRALGLHPHWTH